MSIGMDSKQKAFPRSSSDHVVFVVSQVVIRLRDLVESLERGIGSDLRWGVLRQGSRLGHVPTNAALLPEKGWNPWRAGRCTLLQACVC
jgi:hypothetical protein